MSLGLAIPNIDLELSLTQVVRKLSVLLVVAGCHRVHVKLLFYSSLYDLLNRRLRIG